MTEDERWEILRVNIESLHAGVHELWESSQRHDESISKLDDAISKLLIASREDGEKIRMLSVNIESLHTASSELHTRVSDMSRAMEENDRRLAARMEENDKWLAARMAENDQRLTARMEELIDNNNRLSNIIIAHDERLDDHDDRLDKLEG